MAGIEKYYEITEVYAWQWEGNANITIEDIPEEIRNEVTMLKVERSIKTSFTEESNQLFFNYKGYQYNLFPGDFLIFEYNEFIDGFHFICVEREKDSLKNTKNVTVFCFCLCQTTIEEYDMYIEMLCENCLTEILNKKITAIKPKKIE